MQRRIAARLIQHTQRRQPREATAEALRHAVAIRETQQSGSKQHTFWAGVVEILKSTHLKMPQS